MKHKRLLLTTAFVVCVLFANAATYYVRSTGGSDANNGLTIGTAFQTLTKAFSGTPALADNDVIDISGTFDFYESKSIANSITIQGNNKSTAIIKGLAGSMKNCFLINTAAKQVSIENVTFQDFDYWDNAASNQGGVLKLTAASTLTCRNVDFVNNQAYAGGALDMTVGTAVFEDCYFYNNKALRWPNSTKTSVNANGGAINVSVGSTQTLDVSLTIDRCLFEGNITENYGAAIRFSVPNGPTGNITLLVQNSTITGNITRSIASDGGTFFLDVKSDKTKANVQLKNNTIAYNVCEKTTNLARAGLYVTGDTGKEIVKLYNNIFFSNWNAYTPSQNTSLSFTTTATLKECRNNITDISVDFVAKTTSGATMASDNVSSVISGDLALATAINLANNGGTTKTLAIGSGSVAKNTGYATGAPAVDQRGITRNTVDKGAYEYVTYRSKTSGDWGTAASWQSSGDNTTWADAAVIPTASVAGTMAVQNGHLITVAANATSPSLTVNGGGQLTLNNSTTLGITGNLAINSDVDNGTGTLKNNGTLTVSGTSKVQQYLTNQTWYLTSPVWDGVDILHPVTPTNLSRIQSYMEGSDTGNTWSTSGTTMQPYKGYITTVSDNPKTVEFTGKINSGSISIPLTRFNASTANKYGFNLIGNPYTAYLDWKAVATANASKMPTSTMWYRTNVSGGWAFSTVDGSGNKVPANVSDLIPPMQAFWVRASTVGNSTLDLTTAMLAHDIASGNKLKAPATPTSERTKVRLQVSNATKTDELLIFTDAQASNSFDWYDSPKMTNADANIPEISSVVDGENLVINGLNSIILDTELPIRFMTQTANAFTLKANEISNLPEGVKVILKDNGTEFDLSNGTEYSFSSDVEDNANRFSLLFRSPGVTTDLNSDKSKSQALVFVNAANQITIVASEKSNYTIYNTVGQAIENGITKSELQTVNFKLQTGIYVVKVNNQSTRVIIK